MSTVTNVMLQHDILEPDDDGRVLGVAAVNAVLAREADGQQLKPISRAGWGGRKAPECDLYAAAFNCLPLDVLLAAVESAPWESPRCVRLYVQRQEDATFAVYGLRDGRMVCLLAAEAE